jgi:hypothetical protein
MKLYNLVEISFFPLFNGSHDDKSLPLHCSRDVVSSGSKNWHFMISIVLNFSFLTFCSVDLMASAENSALKRKVTFRCCHCAQKIASSTIYLRISCIVTIDAEYYFDGVVENSVIDDFQCLTRSKIRKIKFQKISLNFFIFLFFWAVGFPCFPLNKLVIVRKTPIYNDIFAIEVEPPLVYPPITFPLRGRLPLQILTPGSKLSDRNFFRSQWVPKLETVPKL